MKVVVNLLFLFLNCAHASEISGNLKSYPIFKDLPGTTEIQKSWQNSFKLQYSHSFPFEIKTEVAYEMTSLLEKHLPLAKNSQSYRYDDLNLYIHDEQDSTKYKMSLAQNLNRLNFSWSQPIGDITIGRQPLAFGSAKSINPTDVLTPFAINSIDKEDRMGVDAIIIKTPLNSTSLIETGFVAGKNLDGDKSAYYFRPKFNFNNFDLSLTAMNFKKRKLYGIDLQHPLWDAGSWIEAGFIDEYNPALKDYVRMTLGVEYKFQNSLYLAGEYHYNGASISDKRSSPSDFVFLQNLHYAIITSTYELTPLFIGSIQAFFNPRDHSIFNCLKLEYNLSENSYVGLGSYTGLGNKSNSEFGRYGKLYFSSIRYYF